MCNPGLIVGEAAHSLDGENKVNAETHIVHKTVFNCVAESAYSNVCNQNSLSEPLLPQGYKVIWLQSLNTRIKVSGCCVCSQ